MSRARARRALLGVLTLLTASSLVAATALAGPGPFAYHREIGSKGNGVKISEQSPEAFQGEGGEQKAASKILGMEVEGVAKSVQIKGIIYNNGLQGQLKMELKFHEIVSVKPNLPECKIKIGSNNTSTVMGHLAWKWSGATKQLEEAPQPNQGPAGVGTAVELKQGTTELPNTAEFTTVSYGTGCGVLTGVYKFKGTETIKTNPSSLGVWSKTLAITLAEEKEKIHFWNGKAFIGGETMLTLGTEPAKIGGESKATVAAQEIAVFES